MRTKRDPPPPSTRTLGVSFRTMTVSVSVSESVKCHGNSNDPLVVNIKQCQMWVGSPAYMCRPYGINSS